MKSEDLQRVFAEAGVLEGNCPDDFTISSLAGYTNENYRLFNGQQDWVIRIPRAETDRFLDRSAEAHNQELAYRLEIAPRVAWRDNRGTTLTPTITGCRALCAADFNNAIKLKKILKPVQRLHRSGNLFHGRVNLPELLSDHFALLSRADQQRLAPRLRQAKRELKQLESGATETVPSHNDLVLDNLLFDDSRVWLIDWEYSAMASPYWDLATLCNSANLDQRQSQRLLQIYSSGSLPMDETILSRYRDLLQLLTDCWMAIHVE